MKDIWVAAEIRTDATYVHSTLAIETMNRMLGSQPSA